MIDPLNEELIDLQAACSLPPFRNPKTGKPCHKSALYRHVLRGSRAANGDRVRLDVVRTPSGLRTSREAVLRFIRALTDPDTPLPPIPTKNRAKQQEAAVAELVAAGFQESAHTAAQEASVDRQPDAQRNYILIWPRSAKIRLPDSSFKASLGRTRATEGHGSWPTLPVRMRRKF